MVFRDRPDILLDREMSVYYSEASNEFYEIGFQMQKGTHGSSGHFSSYAYLE